jgi:hypothetical protein
MRMMRSFPFPRFGGWVVAVLLAVFLLASPGRADTVLAPGYGLNPIGNVPTGSSNSFGSIVQDATGAMFTTGGFNGNVYRRTGGGFSAWGSGPGSITLGAALSGTTLYISTDSGVVFKADTTAFVPSWSAVGNILGAGPVNDIALAPIGFGSFGGQLIAATTNGLFAMNTVTGAVTVLRSGDYWSAVAFTPDGQLLASEYFGANAPGIYKVASNGSLTLFTSDANVDGLAVNAGTGQIVAADASRIFTLSSTGVRTDIVAASLDGGFYPGVLSFNRTGTNVLYGSYNGTSNSYGVNAITGFAANDATGVPLPGVAAAGMALMGAAKFRRRARC